ncbi:hypothetical protein Lal_00018992 [Lupinus albus]|uniref:DNA-directed RNA polymerase subunit n=1 Tax=Lupinus albus TaxID=3870 RepID=A0A6A4R3B8_LUPAL|nr:putative DNA-directed RNA polymerase [Lupinus albus]KAF1898871.1 hypothetical protein Lal_00018992 [Lupinus albus]
MNRARPEGITFTKEPYIEDSGPRRIESMKFSTLSDSEIGKIAEVQVWKGQYYDQFKKPIPSGLLDPRMGPANKNVTCTTCYAQFKDCPGHYGYIKLSLPVFNVGYLGAVVEILKCICKGCARILLNEDTRKERLRKMRSPRIEADMKIGLAKKVIEKCNKATKCLRCGYVNGTVKKAVSAIRIVHDRSKCNDSSVEEYRSALSHTREPKAIINSDTQILDPFQVLSLFKRMHDEDLELIYLAERPEKLIITNIAVPPIAIRPSVIMDGSQSNENDITERLKLIIQANAVLRQELEESSGSSKSLDGWEMLQAEVARFINSDVRGVPFNMQMQKGKTLAGFIQRLKGKQGRFRGNLSGKRVEFTGRTVISPDPNLRISEVAIPIHMATILSYPERVSRHNIEKLRQCVRNGPDKYPGARMLRHADGSSWSLHHSARRKRFADELRFGDIVDRHLEDGDIVLFNRQPSLHRMSIMCHRARIMPWRTLRFNESVCNPYNADFDGDEMNLHVPQTEEARTEAILLMGVQNNLCTPKNGEILVASTQDFLTSSFLITRKDNFYDRSTFSLICSYMGDGMDVVDLPTPAIIKPVELWSGKQLFSILLRPHANVRVYVNLTVKEKIYSTKRDDKKREWKTMCPNDGFVYFRNSELISGQLGKVTLGNGNKDGLFSVLLRDYKAHAAASCMNRLAKFSARWIGNHGFSIGIDDVQPKVELVNKKDITISNGYGKCDRFIEDFNKGKLSLKPGCDAAQTLEHEIKGVLNGLRDEAGKICMQTLHWRNSPLIMSQCGSKGSPINISQMVACVGQQSVGGQRAPNGFMERSLPHFPRNTKTPGAKGFVANSFYTGLSATEFFFHTMGGREGLVDTAVKTADTGYMSRRLMKSLEDLFLHYDSTVRSASNSIVQFCYGDDGMDPAGMEGKDGKPLNFERLFLKSKAICPSDGDDGILSSSEVYKVLQKKLSEVGMSKLLGNGVSEDSEMSEVASSAGFINSLQSFIKDKTEFTKDTSIDGDSKDLRKFIQRISGITRRQLEVFLDVCLSRYSSKKIESGTPIGAIGAHSIGEPGTQMTLKTFHFAGVASMNVTLGVPRIKEIINASKNISTPIITAILDKDDNLHTARIVKGRIEKTNLGQVAKSIKVVMSSRSASVVITLDMKRIQDAYLNIDANIVKESILQAKKIKLKQEHIKVLDIKKLEVVPQDADRSKIHFQLNYLKNLLPSVVVKGIKTAERVVISKEEDKETKADKFNLLVEGTGLREVMGIEGVDGRKTVSNHIDEVEKVLGIEATRNRIIHEIQYTMGSHGMSIDIRHMMLLADIMTARGKVLGITRFGIQQMGKSVLMLASFEKTSDHLFNASVHGRDDMVEGVSECIIMGIPIPIGTGIIKIKQRLDLPELPQGTDPILS